MESIKTAPPLAISAISLVGFSLQEWVLILTIIYTSLQIVFFVKDKCFKKKSQKKER